jgi:hypothetical protein
VLIIILALLLIIVFNIPFGYWRANVVKFSVQWFLAIHLPVPLVALLRKYTGSDGLGLTLLIFLVAYFLGQYIGGHISKKLRRYGRTSSFLLYDLIRRTWIIIIGK